jgi:hypothetical protein
VAEDGKGNVVFTIEAPGVSTKANVIGDGENVDIVYYEIYKAEEGHKNSVKGGKPLIKGDTKIVGKHAELTLNLLQDQNYVALFWANVHGYGEQYYDVTDLRKVQVKYVTAEKKNAPANDEDRAAYCQRHDFATTKSGVNKQRVELVRPFAQINLGTTKESLNLDYLITLEQSRMEIAGAATMFNVAEMKATGDYTHVIYDFNAVPAQYLTVGEKEYAYAGMNYILVPTNQSTVKLTYDIMTDVGTVNRTVIDVPVQMNYRTNLLGNLLTQETVIEIVVDDDFWGDHNVTVE